MIRALGAVVWLAAVLPAQAPRVGDIDLYGLRTISPAAVLAAADVETGGPLPRSKGDMEDRIAQVPGVVDAAVEAVCCQGRDAALFIGIREKGAAAPAFRSAPSGDARLPQDLLDDYRQYLTAVQQAATHGTAGEDLTAGHSTMADPKAHAVEERFAAYARARLDNLRAVLRDGPDENERAVAAAVIGYAPDKATSLRELQWAAQDPDEAVRANALRALNAIAVLATRKPESGLRVDTAWLIDLLHSVVLGDRVESVRVLLTLSDRDARALLDRIRAQALPELIEMARWKTPRYALPPFLLLGRVAGIPDRQVHEDWEKGDREAVIGKAQPVPAGKE